MRKPSYKQMRILGGLITDKMCINPVSTGIYRATWRSMLNAGLLEWVGCDLHISELGTKTYCKYSDDDDQPLEIRTLKFFN